MGAHACHAYASLIIHKNPKASRQNDCIVL
jgi:hypothetical protein